MLYIALILALGLLWIFVRAYKRNRNKDSIIKTMAVIGIAVNIFNVIFALYMIGR